GAFRFLFTQQLLRMSWFPQTQLPAQDQPPQLMWCPYTGAAPLMQQCGAQPMWAAAANNCFQAAAEAAAAAAGACASAGVCNPGAMAAQSIAPGLWCVIVADPSQMQQGMTLPPTFQPQMVPQMMQGIQLLDHLPADPSMLRAPEQPTRSGVP
ncbi:unnamed protein product, partial [Polarella glacialis]